MAKKSTKKKTVAVLGLGRFGEAVAKQLHALGHDVIGIDGDLRIVQSLADELPHIVQADVTETDALAALGVGDVDFAVVAIGQDLESSTLSVLALSELGIRNIWAKASTRRHGVILERLGVSRVVYPEAEMGAALANDICGATDVTDVIEAKR